MTFLGNEVPSQSQTDPTDTLGVPRVYDIRIYISPKKNVTKIVLTYCEKKMF